MDLYLNVPERIFDLLPKYEKEFGPDKVMLAGKENGKWRPYTISETIEIVDAISLFLLDAGIKKDDKIALASRNCPEWNFIDWAIQQVGAIPVPLYPTISSEDYVYDLNHSEAKMLFIYGGDIYHKLHPLKDQFQFIKQVISIRPTEGLTDLLQVIQIGKEKGDRALLQAAKAAVSKDDIASIIYTSGTMGTPKGVMLTHHNMSSNIMNLDVLFPADRNTVLFSYLPLSHIFEHEVVLAFMNLGASVHYAESMGSIVNDIGEVKPTIFDSIPRLIEKFHARMLLTGSKMKGLKKKIFFWAINLGYRYDECNQNSLFYELKRKIADKLVYRKLRDIFGGNVRFIIVGGAAIQPRLAKLFTAMGIPIMEGYGLTETSPVIAVNSPVTKKIKIGTVGVPLQNLSVKISNEGEILVNGPSVMRGYYKDPEQTAQAIDKDGYFHTGDRGIIDKEGFLKLTGRIKEIFKTSMGKYVSPSLVENKLLESPFINSAVVVGEGQKFAAALVIPDFEQLHEWCARQQIAYSSDADMIKEKVIVKKIHDEINVCNQSLGEYERVMRFELLPSEWSLDKGEITGTLKVKRAVIAEHYKDLIENMFKE